jgi:glycosyltransferase involved in cell wall biosynthesis
MANHPVVSVLTPVFNGEDYLEECIQSVLGQTFTDFEYVIVNNMSTDGTAAIAKRFASLDPRIRVVHGTEFVDVYGNHNRALRNMDPGSRYCKFVMADDWLYPECLDKMVKVADQNPSVGIVSAYCLFDKEVTLDGLFPYSQHVMPGREVVRRSLLSTSFEWVVGSPTYLLLRSDLLRQEGDFYNPAVWHADTEAAFRVLLRSDLGFVHQVLTYQRKHLAALSSYSTRVWSFLPLEGRFLIQFGRQVLGAAEYRTQLRRWLWRYARWLAKQFLKPSRYRQKEFHDFHRKEIEFMVANAGKDAETRLVLRTLSRLLR